jgi:glycosyltransferase involved in cell wall biosynthesis
VGAIRSRWPGKRLVGQAGRLLRHKGHDVTVAAARRLAARRPDLQFLLLGDGPRRVELERVVRDLPNVSLLGHVRNIGDYLAALDLFVFPSLTEGLGSSILEAMQAGVPVVASAAGGIPDLIEDGVTGLLVPPGDDAALAAAIAEVTDNPDVGQRLVNAARRRLSEFSPETVSSRYLGLYRQILSPHAGSTGA